MRWLLSGLMVLHGLIHFLGPIRAFELAEVPGLVHPISPGAGVAWGVAGLLLLVTAALFLAGVQRWWVLGFVAVALSQLVIFSAWADARVGTLANLVLLGALAYAATLAGGE